MHPLRWAPALRYTAHDGKEGFPKTYLADATLGCELRIDDSSELMVRSRRSMLGSLDNDWNSESWFATGDLVEVNADRCVFVGRKSDCINVGGAKVYPLEVEAVIRTVPGVREVLVKGRKSSIVGELVIADVVLDEGADPVAARRSILSECRLRLAPYKAPAIVQFKPCIAVNASSKVVRGE